MEYVYTIEFPSNKIYVGCSNDVDFRLYQHKKSSPNKLFDKEVKKFGWDKANVNVVFNTINRERAEEMERELIQKFSNISRSLNFAGNDTITYNEYKELESVDSEFIRLVIEMNGKLKDDFKAKVESEGRNMRYYVNSWIKDYVYDRKEIK